MTGTQVGRNYLPNFSFKSSEGQMYFHHMFLSEQAASEGARPSETEMQEIFERNATRLNDPAYLIPLDKLFALGDPQSA